MEFLGSKSCRLLSASQPICAEVLRDLVVPTRRFGNSGFQDGVTALSIAIHCDLRHEVEAQTLTCADAWVINLRFTIGTGRSGHNQCDVIEASPYRARISPYGLVDSLVRTVDAGGGPDG
jgi:hypothetical protein